MTGGGGIYGATAFLPLQRDASRAARAAMVSSPSSQVRLIDSQSGDASRRHNGRNAVAPLHRTVPYHITAAPSPVWQWSTSGFAPSCFFA